MAYRSGYLTEHRDNAKDKIEDDFLFFATGDDNTAATPSDTTLVNETFRSARDAVDKTTFPAEISTTGEMGPTENNSNTVAEFGWSKVATSNGQTEQRVALTQSFLKTSDISVIIETVSGVVVTEGTP